MKAIRIEKFGDEKVLQLQSVEKPTATESNIVVKLIAAGVNQVDAYTQLGKFIVRLELPFTPGRDGAGYVHEVGSGVTGFKVGQRVFVCKKTMSIYGTYAEYALVTEEEVFPLDDNLNFEKEQL